MAAVIGALRAELSATIAKFQEDMGKAAESVRQFATKAEAQGKRLTRVGQQLSLALTAPLVAFGVKSVKAAQESAEAIGQVGAALQSTGNAAGKTIPQLQQTAKALENISVFDDDDILRDSTANLLKFSNVVGDTFDRAQRAIVDMAAREGDLASATQLVGRALNDPINGLTALTRAGVQFTNQEKEKIKTLIVSGRGIEAQALILDKLEQAYAGAAKAQRDASPTAALNQQWRELTEIIGGILIKVLPPVIDFLRGIAEAFNSLSPGMQQVVVYTGLFAAALGPLLVLVGSLVRAVATLTPLVVALGAALAAITAPVWLIIGAITAAIAALVVFWKSVKDILHGDFTKAWEDAKKTARDMWDDLTSMFAKEPIQAPIEFTTPDGKKISPRAPTFSLPGATGGGGSFPDEINVTPPVDLGADWRRGMSIEMMNVLQDFAESLAFITRSKAEAFATQEELADLHQRRGDSFLSRTDEDRQRIARDLESQKLRAEDRLDRLQTERLEAEITHDEFKLDSIQKQINLENQLLDLIGQTSVEQIRREEQLQDAIHDFTDTVERDFSDMLKNWTFDLNSIRDAFKKLLFDILVQPHIEKAGDALGKIADAAIGAIGGWLGGGGAIPDEVVVTPRVELPGHEFGGFIPPKDWAVVGENGPELAFGGQSGLRVFSNEDSRGMLRGGGGGNTIINQNIRTQDVNSFQRSARQVARLAKRSLQEA